MAQRKAADTAVANANAFAANVGPVIREIRATGASLRQTAKALNARGISTARGGTWTAVQVTDILRRLGEDIITKAKRKPAELRGI